MPQFQTRLDQPGQRGERRLQHARWSHEAAPTMTLPWAVGLGLLFAGAVLYMILQMEMPL